MTVLKSPLFIAVLCLLTNDTHSLTDCKFDSYCQPYGSDWWKYHSSVCYQCPSGKKYHCARDYDSKEFKEDCAEEKFCPEGEEPNLSYWKNGQEITEPIVYCEPCHDKERFNSQQNTSSAEYSECPDPKWNKCTEDRHKILCKPDDSTEDRYCRCDARKGFSPVNDFSYEKCSYKDYDCRDYRKCDNKEELLLNYTCAAKCPDGFGRLDEDTDDCKLIPTVKTESIILSSLKTTNSNSTTLPSTFSPESTEKPSQGCEEECHEYKICVDGKCVCPDNCTSVREPVCGHHAGSKSEYKTFPSICELKRRYCTDKKYIFHSNGECSKEDSKLPVQLIIVIVIVGIILVSLVLFIIFKTNIGRRCRNRCFPPQGTEVIYNRSVDGDLIEINTNSSVDGDQRNTMPLDEVPSNNNRSGPKGSQRNRRNVSIKNVYYYHAPVVYTEGGETHLSMTNGSENITVKYNKDQLGDGEGDPLLTGEDDTVSIQEPVNANRSTQSENGSSLNSTASVEEILEKKNTDAYVNVETDSDELPRTEKDHSNLGRTYKRQRQNSMSCDSLFLKPNITDIEEVTNGKSECKEVINKVMDKSITYLVENMDSKAVIDRFTAKEILTHNKRRDILDLVKQSDQSREIIKNVRETGAHNYQALKTCLAESKQSACFEKLEQIQNEVVKDLRKKQNLEKPEEQQSSQQKKGPCFVPSEEEKACNFLKNIMKIYDGKKNDDTENAFKAFTNLCEDITQQFPYLEFEDIVKDSKLPDSLPVQEEYRNTPEGFQAYKSSGRDNSCLYQSISLLLKGTEDYQCFFRLMGTLHAAREYPTYKERLQLLDPEQRKLFFYTQSRQIQDVDDSEDINDKFLKTLIMETACVGTDSSVLHVAFLSGALGLNIHQYFQHYEDNGAKLVEMLKDIDIPGRFLNPDLPELHVFWVNMKNEENGIINHFVPLLPKKETTEVAFQDIEIF